MKPRFLLLASLALTACATGSSGGPEDAGRRGEEIDTVCFTGGLSGFYEAGSNAVILRRSPSESYLVETGYCPNMRAVEGLKIDDPSMCLKRGSRLLVYDTQFPRSGEPADRPDRCLVNRVYEWLPAQNEEMIALAAPRQATNKNTQ
ncbi:DUF6491 family protein [Hyphococcus sp.]|uniref:DUF6491 family protein n=1 Tax=Hyphococcus sp. TaxID=2038636 RepID=UPI0035C68B26